MRYAIGGEVFATKKALESRVRSITGGALGEIAIADYPFVVSLFERHPTIEEKAGSGIARILVAIAAPYSTRCFVIERTDGTRIDISWRECLAPTGPLDWFRAACRTAVVRQVQAAKPSALVTCPITGDPIDRDTCHVDHAPPWTFVAIADAFIAARSLDLADVQFDDSGVESRFLDQALADDFAAFHRERAVLRAVSKRANLSILRRRS